MAQKIDPANSNARLDSLSEWHCQLLLDVKYLPIGPILRAGATFSRNCLTGNTGILAGEPASEYQNFSRDVN